MRKDFQGQEVVYKNYLGQVVDLQGRPVPEEPPVGLIDPETPAGVDPVGHASFAGSLVFSDEFQDGELNTEKWIPNYPNVDFWNTTVPGGYKTNTDEPQGYDLSGITFDSDGMVLTLREDNAAVPELDYTSGMVCSYPSFSPTYGYFEARMLLPNADDAWPAFWLFPEDHSWPPEIDIMENDGKDAFNLQTYHTFHYPNPPGGSPSSDVYHYENDVGNGWHVFGALWEPERIRWYVDGDLAKDLTLDSELADGNMFIICNLAGKKNSTPAAPFSAKVSHIRAWSLELI